MYDSAGNDMSRATEQVSCYFTAEERRDLEEIADREERRLSKIVQFAVRTFRQQYRENREKAMQLAQQPGK